MTETAETIENTLKLPDEKKWISIFKQCKKDGIAEFPGPSLTSGDEGMLGGGSHAVGTGYFCALDGKTKREQCSAKICQKITHSATKKMSISKAKVEVKSEKQSKVKE